MLPTDGDPEIVYLHAPIETVVWTFTAERFGAPPDVPTPEMIDSNLVLLSASIGACIPILDVQGSGHHWGITGTYTYALKKAKGLTAPIPTGKMPWEPGDANDNVIPSDVFKTGIISDPYVPGGPGAIPGGAD